MEGAYGILCTQQRFHDGKAVIHVEVMKAKQSVEFRKFNWPLFFARALHLLVLIHAISNTLSTVNESVIYLQNVYPRKGG